MPEYRPLTETEMGVLRANGCHATDWGLIAVRDPFDPDRVRRVSFRGPIRIGRLGGTLRGPDGLERESELIHAHLEDVVVGDGCRIVGVTGRLAHVDIEDRVLIESVGSVVCTGPTRFANGKSLTVLNEGGGRELLITRLTSGPMAYMTVVYRHHRDLTERLNRLAEQYAREQEHSRTRIGRGSCVRGCGEIVNVWIGPGAVLDGVTLLCHGTVDSTDEDPVHVGPGVIARDFIFQSGAHVTDGAEITGSLVGQGVRIGRHFSADQSVLFANSEGFHSECCALLAGPYTVTHHRSTLLIAGLFSFFNAGSGTNQSNHMYKLGPVHQGILERGCKTGSGSYLLWPSRIGAFSVVIGKHGTNLDTADFPFSYIAEEEGRSTLVPAMNFFTVGTVRDAEKWPNRDRRKSRSLLDPIIFDVLSPYTALKMIRGRDRLAKLARTADKAQSYVLCGGVHIKRLLLKTCSRYYSLILNKYVGDTLLRRVKQCRPSRLVDILEKDPAGYDGQSAWIDAAGLLCAKDRMESVIHDVRVGRIVSQQALQDAFWEIYRCYRADEWNWVLAHSPEAIGWDLREADPDALRRFLGEWKEASLKLFNMVLGDAEKEFADTAKIGFGVDGSVDEDFAAVRGSFAENSFVRTIRQRMAEVEAACDQMIALTV